MMRNGQNKRMRGRNRNNNSNNSSSNHNQNRGHHHHNPLTRVYESNGPDVKIRGTAHHIAEKYMQLARDASSSGDHVTAEAHHQHAEHYLRLIATAQEQFRQQNPHYQPPPPPGGGDGSFEEGDENAAQPAQGQPNFSNQPSAQSQPFGNPQPYGGPQPQSQPQPSFGGQQPQHTMRPPQQQPQPQQQQPQQQQPQPSYGGQQPQPQVQPAAGGDIGGLPSFITGGQPQPNLGTNGHDSQGDRFSHRRRRRHRGPQGVPDIHGAEIPEAPGTE